MCNSRAGISLRVTPPDLVLVVLLFDICHQVPKDEVKVSMNASTPQAAGEVGTGESSEMSQIATENSIVSGLVGTDDAEPPRVSGEAASVPSAEEGLNLWESDGTIGEAATPTDVSTTQVMTVALRAVLFTTLFLNAHDV